MFVLILNYMVQRHRRVKRESKENDGNV